MSITFSEPKLHETPCLPECFARGPRVPRSCAAQGPLPADYKYENPTSRGFLLVLPLVTIKKSKLFAHFGGVPHTYGAIPVVNPIFLMFLCFVLICFLFLFFKQTSI